MKLHNVNTLLFIRQVEKGTEDYTRGLTNSPFLVTL